MGVEKIGQFTPLTPMKAAYLVLAGLTLCTAWIPSPHAIAQTCNYYAGQAVDGQSINVDLCSISRASYRSADFVYHLGKESMQAVRKRKDTSGILEVTSSNPLQNNDRRLV